MADRHAPTLPRPEFLHVPLELLEQTDQIRTESGLDDSLDDLAEDIAARGVIQPITIRPADAGEGYVIVAGHRRAFAAALAGLETVPAIVRHDNADDAFMVQLAENIQREDLNLAEKAAAIRKLFDKHQDLATVAALVKKSKPWVSKHLAATCPDFSWRARQLLEDGAAQDLELLGAINQIDKLGVCWSELQDLVDQVKAGKAGRAQAQQLLAQAREKKRENDAALKAAAVERAKKSAPTPSTPTFRPGSALYELDELAREGADVATMKAEYDAKEWQLIIEELRPRWKDGMTHAAAQKKYLLRAFLKFTDPEDTRPSQLQAIAWAMGAQRAKLDVDTYLAELVAVVGPVASK